MKYSKIREEELKNRVGTDFFPAFNCDAITQNVDFSVKIKNTETYLLWAEAKTAPTDIIIMLAQLVLTIGKARTFDKILPPPFLGCFDCAKIAVIPYHEIQELFYVNDFNWNVTPSNHETREFKLIREKLKKITDTDKIYVFDFDKDKNELKTFIKENFRSTGPVAKLQIDKNNFINIYNKWLETVKPTILLHNWEKAKKAGIIDGDFYLADLLSSENQTLKEKLFVVLKQTKYVMNRHENEMGLFTSTEVDFSDNQRAHTKFWAVYERPPKAEYWDYIVERRDLLVPQDVRERKGSFFTPKIWVELSQKYIADAFGKNWQDEYYVWDCAAGTGNLLAGLTNKYNIWASTLDQADVNAMHTRIDTMNGNSISGNGANLLHEHVFRFDFLNDDFEKLPKKLQEIIKKTPEKLIIYINPPYAEVSSIQGGKKGVNQSKMHDKYLSVLGTAGRELFTQFFIRICKEIPHSNLAAFSKLKYISGSAFECFRNNFLAEYENGFVCLANTFDNVSGNFPIGFTIWNFKKQNKIEKVKCDVFDKTGVKTGKKTFYAYKNEKYINKWISSYNKKPADEYLGFLAGTNGNDFQTNKIVYIINKREQMPNPRGIYITIENLIEISIYFTVRKVIPATWLNDRDQFLYPNNKWKKDIEFQNDCLAYTLFSNNISSKHGVNHWIPFMERDVNARDKFDSHFMMSFIRGKLIQNGYSDLFEQQEDKMCIKREFSPEAKDVFTAGRKLWQYYHKQPECDVNASLYDIREHFQGRNDKGTMNAKSEDARYTELIENLRAAIKVLAKKTEPKIYEYGFLRE